MNTDRDGPLAECWVRIDRADELTRQLGEELDKAAGGLSFSVQGTDGLAIIVHVSEQPPWDRFGAIVGEIVHDLRSALDHSVFVLSESFSGPLDKTEARSVSFPVFDDHQAFYATNKRGRADSRGGLHPIRLIDPGIAPLIDRFQPFHRQRPGRHPLAILRELSNQDKHRAPALCAVIGRAGQIVIESEFLRARSRTRSVPAPLTDGAVVARVRTGTWTGPPPKTGATLTITWKVAINVGFGFAPGPPAFGGGLVPRLFDLRREVTRVLRALGDPRLL